MNFDVDNYNVTINFQNSLGTWEEIPDDLFMEIMDSVEIPVYDTIDDQLKFLINSKFQSYEF